MTSHQITMNQKSLFRLLLASLSLFTVGNACSQTPTSSPKQALIFRTLGADCAPEGLNVLSGSNAVPVSIQQGMRSMPQNYSGASPMVLFRLVTGKDGKPTQMPVATIDLSSAGKYPLIVFFKGTKGTELPVVQILHEDAKSFPPGTFRIANYSTNSLIASLPGGSVQVLPSSVKDYVGKNGGIFPVGISEISSLGNNLIFNSNIGVLPASRTMFLVIPSTSPGGHVQIQRHTDGVPAQ